MDIDVSNGAELVLMGGCRGCRPSGARLFAGRVPGLTPWANEFRPFGAGVVVLATEA